MHLRLIAKVRDEALVIRAADKIKTHCVVGAIYW
jgi:hypothetical protein